MDYSMTVTLDLPYDQAVPAVKQALQEQGFGVLTEIDARATLKEKLGEDPIADEAGHRIRAALDDLKG